MDNCREFYFRTRSTRFFSMENYPFSFLEQANNLASFQLFFVRILVLRFSKFSSPAKIRLSRQGKNALSKRPRCLGPGALDTLYTWVVNTCFHSLSAMKQIVLSRKPIHGMLDPGNICVGVLKVAFSNRHLNVLLQRPGTTYIYTFRPQRKINGN